MEAKKWLEGAPDEEKREIPMISLSEACALTTRSRFLIAVADWCLLRVLRTGGSSILKAVHGRRGLSLMQDIGLKQSAQYLNPRLLVRGLVPPPPILDSSSQLEFSSVLEENKEKKSSLQEGKPEKADNADPGGPNTLS